MAKINTFSLNVLMVSELREHDYFSFISFSRTHSLVRNEEIYDALLCPQKSPYLKMGAYKTILQANATLLNVMFYAVYSGYLFASIMEDELYDKQIWSYYYMHKKLNGHIYEPIFVSLLPLIFDYQMSENLKELYIKDSRNVFSIVYRSIYSFIIHEGLENLNIYDNVDKESLYYKEDLPELLNEMHKQGVYIFYAGKHDHKRQEGKNLTSTNLWGDKNKI